MAMRGMTENTTDGAVIARGDGQQQHLGEQPTAYTVVDSLCCMPETNGTSCVTILQKIYMYRSINNVLHSVR